MPGLPPLLPQLLRHFLHSVLTSLGQIYFQSAPLAGLVLLLCLYLSSPYMALCALLAATVATLSAYAPGFSPRLRRQGLYGFNAALSAIGLCSLYRYTPALLGWITLAGISSTLLSHAFLRWSTLPVLSLPFVLVMWLAAYAGPTTGLQALNADAASSACSSAVLTYPFCISAKIAFMESPALGLLILSTVTWRRWQLGAWVVLGAMLAWYAWILGDSLWPQAISATLATGIGVNCMLVTLALSVYQRAWIWRILACGWCILLCLILAKLGVSYFTLPFVLASWSALALSAPVAAQDGKTQQAAAA
ncbi:urea transporter [Undibacterium sp. Ren11W]|uniref:urea transporter n=1 Tax=Undibacterium sp. Ren11W TaxID=3413045 RepID=UPI003BF3F004